MPIATWARSWDRRWLRADLLAGLTLWGLVVPEAIAYAGIAGLPPEAGLYVLLVSLLVYALLGSSRHLVVGGTSATAALLASSVATVAATSGAGEFDPSEHARYSAAFVLVLGGTYLVAAVARLGFITQFLSRPVMDGFILGLATFVMVGQFDELLGIESTDGNTIERVVGAVRQLSELNAATAIVGALAIVVLFVLPRIGPALPAGLIVLVAAIATSSALDLDATWSVAVVGTIPAGLPSLALPDVPRDAWLDMIPMAVGVLLVAFSEGLGVARDVADRHGYEVDADQELRSLAAANIASSFVGGLIAAGSMSATAVNEGAGARSQVANLVAWGATIVTVLALTPLFAPLPEAVLAALIIHALWHIVASRRLRQLRDESRIEFWFGLATFAGVLVFDVFEGMVIGVVASLLFVVYRSSRPSISVLGRVPGVPGAWSDLTRHPGNVAVPGLLIVRLDGPLWYANAITNRERIMELVDATDPTPRVVLLDAASQYDLDVTSREQVERLVHSLQERGIVVAVSNVHESVRGLAERGGIIELLGDDHVFASTDAAVAALTPLAAEHAGAASDSVPT